MNRLRAALVFGALVVAATAGASDGGVVRAPLDGELDAPEAVVRVARARLELGGEPRVEAGVTIGLATFDELEGEIEIRNGLDHAVQALAVELAVRRDAPGSATVGKPASEDEEAAAAAAEARTLEMPGWTFKIAVAGIAAGGSRVVPCRFTLPPLPATEQPASPAELSYSVRITGYSVTGLRLAPALSLLARGAPSDQRAVFNSYGKGLGATLRAADEAELVGVIDAAATAGPVVTAPPPPPAAASHPGAAAAASLAPPRVDPALLRFSFVLVALGRVGAERALVALLAHEEAIAAGAPQRPEHADDDKAPPPNSDLVAASFSSEVHEALVKVAHRNLSILRRLVVRPSQPPNPAEGAAWQFAADEELVETDDWLEASSEAVTRVPAELVEEHEAAARDQLQLVHDLLTPPPDDLEPFAAVLRGKDATLRAVVATALARAAETNAGAARLLVGALDEEDDARAEPIVAAFGGGGALLRAPLAEQLARLDAKAVAAAGNAGLARQLCGAFRERRARSVAAALDAAEAEVARDPLSDAVPARLALARTKSPRAFAAASVRMARLAATLYRARVAAGRADARTILLETALLAPIDEPSFVAAMRDARIADARALAATDLDGAIAFLCDGAALPKSGAERDAALSLILDRADRAIDAHETRSAHALLGKARRFGADAATLAPRERRLRMLRLAPRAAVLGAAAVLLAAALAGLVVARRRRARAAPARPAA